MSVPGDLGGMSDRTWGAVTAVFLCAVVPTLLIVNSPLAPGASRRLWLWALGITVLTGLLFSVTVGSGRRRLFQLTFAMFSYVWMGLAPLVQLRLNRFAQTTPNLDPKLMFTAVLVVLTGIGAWLAGSYISSLVPSTGLWRRRSTGGQVSELRVYLFSAFTLLLAAYYVTKIGWRTLFSSREAIYYVQLAVWPNPSTMVLITSFCTISLIVPVAALRVVDANRRAAGLSVLGVRAWIGVLTVVLLLVVNPISSSRYLFGTVAFTLAVLFGVVSTKRRFRLFAVGIVAAMVLVFPYADKFRYSGTTSQSKGGVIEAMTTGDYDAFGQVNNTVAYVNKLGTTHGRQAAGVALFWVPRGLWPDKPTDTGILLADFRGYSFSNLSAPLWTELFINGGWVTLVLGMGAVGAFSRRADDKGIDWSRPLSPLGAILPFYMIILLRGSLLQATLTLSIILVCAYYLRPRTVRAR